MSSSKSIWMGTPTSTFTFINIHKTGTMQCRKIPVKTVCHHEQPIPLERKQGKWQNKYLWTKHDRVRHWMKFHRTHWLQPQKWQIKAQTKERAKGNAPVRWNLHRGNSREWKTPEQETALSSLHYCFTPTPSGAQQPPHYYSPNT